MTVQFAWWLVQFGLCAVLIGCAGFTLSRSADRLARAYGWGRGWVGLALLATVTSLPELASGISAVAFVQSPNLAVGNALGACLFNLGFLVVVDALQRQQPMYREAGTTHLLTAGFGVVMLGFVALIVMAGARVPAFLHVGVYSPVLLGLYLLALRGVHQHEQDVIQLRSELAGADPRVLPSDMPDAHREWRRFVGAAAVVLVAGSWLPGVADALATASGLSSSFVGTVMVAGVTTLPEMAVTLAALRLRALDMAIGNLLGSNLFNVLILSLDDLFYAHGPLLAAVDPVHAGTAVAAMIMSGLVIVGLMMRPQGRVLRVVSWISVGLISIGALQATLVLLGTG